MPLRHRVRTVAAMTLCATLGACYGGPEAGSDDDPGILESGTLEGTAEVRVAMYHDRVEPQYYLNTDDGSHIRVLFEADAETVQPDERLALAGHWNRDKALRAPTFMATGVLKRLGFDQAAGGSGSASGVQLAAATGGLRAPMLHRVAVLMLGAPSYTRAQALAQVNQTPGSAGSFLTENSDGIDAYEGDVFGPYAVDTSDCANRTDEIADLAKAAAAAEGKNLAPYTNIAILMPPGSSCGWGGLGNVGSPGSTRQRITWYNNRFTCHLVAHELGHNLGFHHSHSTACGTALYAANRAGCKDTEYGDVFDVMGDGDCVGAHFSAPQKQYQGWLDNCEDVTAGGTAVFNVSPLEGDCGVRSLRIPVPGEDRYYYLEYRKVSAGAFGGAAGADRVVLSVSDDAASVRPNLYRLDSTPQSSRGFKDGWLAVGATYSLPGSVQIQVLEIADVARVRVTMANGSGPTCRNGQAPGADTSGRFGVGCSITSDGCPNDPNKTEPGVCGCGVSEVDTDGDGVRDCTDRCPSDPKKTDPGSCGCGVTEGACAGIYQGESATAQSGSVVSAANSGYTGSGYMDFGGNGTWMEWNNVRVATAGSYKLTFRYANRSSSARTCTILRNGTNVGSVAFNSTGSSTNWGTATLTVSLSAGNNTIRVLANNSIGGPNLDKMELSGGTPADLCPNDPAKTAPGLCGCGVPEGTCAQTPTVTMSKSTYAVNESIVVNFAGAAGSSTDWVGLFASGAANTSHLVYQYTAGKVSGSMTFASRAAGNYEARLFFNDGYTLKAKVAFTVK